MATFKQSIKDSLLALAESVRGYLPELGDESWSVCRMALVNAGALWTYTHPSERTLAADAADLSLADLHFDFVTDLETTLARLITGTLARAAP